MYVWVSWQICWVGWLYLSVVGCFALPLGCPLGWRGGTHLVVLIEEPVLLWVIQRVDHLGHQLVLLRDLEHGTRILVPAAVIRG